MSPATKPPIETAGEFTFARLLHGALAIGHRPARRSFKGIRSAGLTHVVTLLSESENPQPIGARTRHLGLAWMWVPIGSTKVLATIAKPEIRTVLESLVDILQGGGRIYLHCSAGIHRTGMIGAALLFRLGYDEFETRDALEALRPITAHGMGAARFEWARSFCEPGLA